MQYFIIKTINNCKKYLHFIWYHAIIKTVKEYTLTTTNKLLLQKSEREVSIMAKKLNNYRRTVQYLQKIYNLINDEYFNGELEEITLTVQESVRSYGHVSVSNTWFTDDKAMKELNISANYLRRDITEVVTTLIHECSHIWNMQHDIKDTSNGYIYHNKNFKKTAEDLGKIQIDRHEKYGWTISTPTEETIDFCIRNGLEDIQIGRQDSFSFGGFTGGTSGNGTPIAPKTRKPSSTRKYICPCCGNSFRATKQINVMCMDCNEQFVIAE